ncbi:MAG: deoxynucleoside kinase [Polyangia bacterium]
MTLPTRHIAVEGPIGVGKSALAQRLADALGARVVLADQGNPFLDGFYADPRRYALQAQLSFLLGRYQQRDELRQEGLFQRGVVTDYVFARDRLFARLNLSRDELALYDKVYALLDEAMPRPDLVVYLQARTEVLVERLRKSPEGRRVPREYVARVNEAYAEFFFHYYVDSPLLVVNTSEIDFVARREDLDDLVAVIQRTRNGVHHYSPLGAA